MIKLQKTGLNMLMILVLLGLMTACHSRVIQQGNVLKEDNVEQIKVGDSRFRVETMMGSAALKDSLHPRHVYYIEQYENPETDEAFIRRVDIVYDKALRVLSIERTGMKPKQDAAAQTEGDNHG
ncbi:MAG: outer membrane protein assembly factor BamE [Mariprofundaceae bacterium]|nr:outer membrane protein assembly factor BamE [Mariprofundaceae bacterium]